MVGVGGIKFIVTLNTFTILKCTETGSMKRRGSLKSETRHALRVKDESEMGPVTEIFTYKERATTVLDEASTKSLLSNRYCELLWTHTHTHGADLPPDLTNFKLRNFSLRDFLKSKKKKTLLKRAGTVARGIGVQEEHWWAVTGTLRHPDLRFSRAFSSVVRQMSGYNSQRRGTARNLPHCCVVLCTVCV